MPDEDDRYQRVNLRLPRDLHAQLMNAAARRSHSMNAEVIARLTQSFRPEAGEETDIDELVEQYDRLGALLNAAVEKLQAAAAPPGRSTRPFKRRE